MAQTRNNVLTYCPMCGSTNVHLPKEISGVINVHCRDCFFAWRINTSSGFTPLAEDENWRGVQTS